ASQEERLAVRGQDAVGPNERRSEISREISRVPETVRHLPCRCFSDLNESAAVEGNETIAVRRDPQTPRHTLPAVEPFQLFPGGWFPDLQSPRMARRSQ